MLAAWWSFGAQAQTNDKGAQFGFAYGLSVPDADNTSPFHLFGVKGSAFIVPSFSVGAYVLYSDKTGEQSSVDQFTYSLTGVEAAYHIPTASGDTFIAFRVGLTKLRTSPNDVPITFSPYHYGIAAGYDYYFTSWLALGFEGSYLHILPGRTFQNTVEYDQPSFSLINFLVTLQFRL